MNPLRPTNNNAIGGWNRAQNIGTSKLQQHKDRAKAAVSMNQAIDQAAGRAHNQKSTSIFHPGGAGEGASTSIAHPGGAHGSIYGDLQEQERDERRHDFARKQIIRKKLLEKQAQQKEINQSFHGSSQKKAKSLMDDVLEEYGSKKRLGQRYDDKTRKAMKKKVDFAKSRGHISDNDVTKMKRLIDRFE